MKCRWCGGELVAGELVGRVTAHKGAHWDPKGGTGLYHWESHRVSCFWLAFFLSQDKGHERVVERYMRTDWEPQPFTV